jgi:cobalt-zinc-cadmium resistance protein CzcA
VRSDVAIKLFGEDLDVLMAKANEIVAVVSKIPGARDTKAELVTGLPQMQIKVDRAAIARYGINVADVQEIIETAIGGKSATQVIEGDKRFDLVVRFPERSRNDRDAISNILVSAPGGERVPLSQLGTISMDLGPAQISRDNVHRRIAVEANVRGRDLAGFVSEARRAVERKVKLPPGYWIEWGGQVENLERAAMRLGIVVPLTLFLIFVMLYTTFHSARLALLISVNVPAAATGGILALAARGMPFSISAAVGFIALFGVAVLNGVVLVSYVNQVRRQGLAASEAAFQGAAVRLRPVLMTALVASLGFVPMALSTGAGAEVQRPLATVVIGGLVTSTLLTLIVLPAIYRWFAEDTAPA